MSCPLKQRGLLLTVLLVLSGSASGGEVSDGPQTRAQRLQALFLAAGGQSLLEERLTALLAQEEANAVRQRDRVMAGLQADAEQAARFAQATAEHLTRLRQQVAATTALNAGQLQDAAQISDQDLDTLLAFYQSPAYRRAASWLATIGPGVTGIFDQQYSQQAEASRQAYARRLRQLAKDCACPR